MFGHIRTWNTITTGTKLSVKFLPREVKTIRPHTAYNPEQR